MIELAILELLRAYAPLLALLGSGPKSIDLVDVAQGTDAPYLTFNFTEGSRIGKGNLCDPTAPCLMSQTLMLTPWAATAQKVQAINTAAMSALVGGPRVVGGVAIQSITRAGYQQWAREPETNLLTRGQLLTVQHTE